MSRPLGIAALIAWLVTASIGAYMLRTWVARGGLNRQRATGVGVPPLVVFGHASVAAAGLLVWVGSLASRLVPLAWLSVGLVAIAITLGICMVTLWTPYPVREAPAEASLAGTSGMTGPTSGDAARAGDEHIAGQGEKQAAFRVTDEMIASLLADPFPTRRRRKLQLVPLIPVCHGFAAITTFLLAMLAALGGRLARPEPVPPCLIPAPVGCFARSSGRLEAWQKR